MNIKEGVMEYSAFTRLARTAMRHPLIFGAIFGVYIYWKMSTREKSGPRRIEAEA